MRCHVTKWPNQAVGWCARELPQQGNNWCSRAWTSVVSPEALPHPASPNPQSSFLTPVSASTLTLTSLEPSPCLDIPRETLILLSCHPFLMTKATVYSSKGLSSCTFLTRLSPGPFPYIRCFYRHDPHIWRDDPFCISSSLSPGVYSRPCSIPLRAYLTPTQEYKSPGITHFLWQGLGLLRNVDLLVPGLEQTSAHLFLHKPPKVVYPVTLTDLWETNSWRHCSKRVCKRQTTLNFWLKYSLKVQYYTRRQFLIQIHLQY